MPLAMGDIQMRIEAPLDPISCTVCCAMFSSSRRKNLEHGELLQAGVYWGSQAAAMATHVGCCWLSCPCLGGFCCPGMNSVSTRLTERSYNAQNVGGESSR